MDQGHAPLFRCVYRFSYTHTHVHAHTHKLCKTRLTSVLFRLFRQIYRTKPTTTNKQNNTSIVCRAVDALKPQSTSRFETVCLWAYRVAIYHIRDVQQITWTRR